MSTGGQSERCGALRRGAAEVSRTVPQTPFAYRRRLRFLLERIERWAAAHGRRPDVLDVGCGSGMLVTTPIASLGLDVLGIDTHAESVRLAQRRNRYANARYEAVRTADLVDAGRRFDIIICSEVLEHVRRPEELLGDIRRLVRPDGLVLVTIPNGYGPKEMEDRVFFLVRWASNLPGLRQLKHGLYRLLRLRPAPRTPALTEGLCREGHLRFFTVRSFRKVAEACGFAVVEQSNRRVLGGKLSARFLGRSRRLTAWNAACADRVPAWLASAWMFVLLPRS